MKPITEKRQKELIEYIEAVLSAHIQYGGDSDEEDVFKIALASLNAEPVGYISDSNLKVLCKGAHSVYIKPKPVMVRPNAIYTSPPATVIKLPEYVTKSDMSVDEFCNGYNMAIDVIKNINGIDQ